MRTVLLFTAFSLFTNASVLGGPLSDQDETDMRHAAVAGAYTGPRHLPDFRGRDRNFASYRTRLIEGVKAGPSFAGDKALVVFGCGTQCRQAYIVSVRTGQVTAFPLGGEDNLELNLKHSLRSSMIIAYWVNENRCYRQIVNWTGDAFQVSPASDIGTIDVCRAIPDAS